MASEARATTAPVTTGAPRRGYIDWMRGLAILIMIEAHVLDAWTRPADRALPIFGFAMLLAGMGAPIFLFLAGLAVVLSADSKEQRSGRSDVAAAAVRRRGWQIFLYAFLFRAQSFVLNPGAPLRSLLKVDILNIMGPSIAFAATLWGWVRREHRLAAFALATALVALVTPPIRGGAWLAVLPDPIEAYIRPLPGRTNFTFFPWAGFVLAGAAAGAVIAGRRPSRADRRLHAWLLLSGVALALGAYGASFLPSMYATSSFWTTSPAFFFIRTGILVATLGIVYFALDHPPRTAFGRFAPMQRFGRSSLFVYWIHVEMVYGVVSWPLHKRLALGEVVAAFVLFTLFLFALVLVKERVVGASAGRAKRRDVV
jgi:uncharacterized membrane protein